MYFSNAKVGNKVWDYVYWEGKIIELFKNVFRVLWKLEVGKPSFFTDYYYDGLKTGEDDGKQRLFYYGERPIEILKEDLELPGNVVKYRLCDRTVGATHNWEDGDNKIHESNYIVDFKDYTDDKYTRKVHREEPANINKWTLVPEKPNAKPHIFKHLEEGFEEQYSEPVSQIIDCSNCIHSEEIFNGVIGNYVHTGWKCSKHSVVYEPPITCDDFEKKLKPTFNEEFGELSEKYPEFNLEALDELSKICDKYKLTPLKIGRKKYWEFPTGDREALVKAINSLHDTLERLRAKTNRLLVRIEKVEEIHGLNK